MSQSLSRKHFSSDMSYTQSIKEGDNSLTYTSEYKNTLVKADILMYKHLRHATISDTSKKLCITLLNADYKFLEYTLFQSNFFWITLNRVCSRNEARVIRDIMLYIVSLAEILCTCDILGLEYLTKEINAE